MCPRYSLVSDGISAWLARYGDVMRKDEASHELRLDEATSLRMARRRGSINLATVNLPGQKQDFYRTKDVFDLLRTWKDRKEGEPTLQD